MKAHKKSGVPSSHIFNLGNGFRWVVNFVPWFLYLWERTLLTHRIGRWVGHRASLDVLEKRKISCLYKDSNPRQS